MRTMDGLLDFLCKSFLKPFIKNVLEKYEFILRLEDQPKTYLGHDKVIVRTTRRRKGQMSANLGLTEDRKRTFKGPHRQKVHLNPTFYKPIVDPATEDISDAILLASTWSGQNNMILNSSKTVLLNVAFTDKPAICTSM